MGKKPDLRISAGFFSHPQGKVVRGLGGADEEA